ncbi:H-NS histone family protein [Caballeronia concitans]|uniref:H-NS histone family protein n=1 Tax=Caballeronia concitans TaxID=1777133 RepID=UPI001FCCA9FB|nr:H-NS histone family protein [Caballeronia concitans]
MRDLRPLRGENDGPLKHRRIKNCRPEQTRFKKAGHCRRRKNSFAHESAWPDDYDLTNRCRAGAAKDPANAALAATRKYRDPDRDPGATWSGRGRAPAWRANVKNRARFLVFAAASLTIPTRESASETTLAVPNRRSTEILNPEPSGAAGAGARMVGIVEGREQVCDLHR